MDNDNTVKHKKLIMIQVVSTQAWIKNNPNPTVDKEILIAYKVISKIIKRKFKR